MAGAKWEDGSLSKVKHLNRLIDRLDQEDGCDIAPHCLECPLSACRYEMKPGQAKVEKNTQKLADLLEAGHTMESAAVVLGKSRRSVYRLRAKLKQREEKPMAITMLCQNCKGVMERIETADGTRLKCLACRAEKALPERTSEPVPPQLIRESIDLKPVPVPDRAPVRVEPAPAPAPAPVTSSWQDLARRRYEEIRPEVEAARALLREAEELEQVIAIIQKAS